MTKFNENIILAKIEITLLNLFIVDMIPTLKKSLSDVQNNGQKTLRNNHKTVINL